MTPLLVFPQVFTFSRFFTYLKSVRYFPIFLLLVFVNCHSNAFRLWSIYLSVVAAKYKDFNPIDDFLYKTITTRTMAMYKNINDRKNRNYLAQKIWNFDQNRMCFEENAEDQIDMAF